MKPRVVLDTNVCLDLFVFGDRRCASLHAALTAGEIEAVTREDCRREWQIVLGYSHLSLDEAARQRLMTVFDASIVCLPTVTQTMAALPLCRDADDQKFLELARDAQAAVLLSKDKALLKLAKRTVRAGMFEIALPEHWQSALQAAAAKR